MIAKDARMIAVYGRRGSGKSTRVKRITARCRRLVVFDPCDEYAREAGLKRVTRYQSLLDAIARGWRRGFRVAFVPEPGLEAIQLSDIASILWKVQRPYELGRDARKLTLVVEEMDLSYPVRALPAEFNGMPRLCNQGRHVGIEIIGVTQRPAQISATFRGNVAESYVFPLAWAEDRNAILAIIGREHAAALAALRDHEYLHFSAGVVSKGKNLPIGKKQKSPIGKVKFSA